MYGRPEMRMNGDNVLSLLAAGMFFDDDDLCLSCQRYCESNISSMNAVPLLTHFEEFYYGPYSEKILQAVIRWICRNGTDDDGAHFTELDLDWIESILSSDSFYAESESQRLHFLVRVLKSRAAAGLHDDPQRVARLLESAPLWSHVKSPELTDFHQQGVISHALVQAARDEQAHLRKKLETVKDAELGDLTVCPSFDDTSRIEECLLEKWLRTATYPHADSLHKPFRIGLQFNDPQDISVLGRGFSLPFDYAG
jgi:hypothetical protein